MTLTEISNTLESDFDDFNTFIKRYDIFVECCLDNHGITCAKIKRDILLESGDDYNLKLEEASETFGSKISTAVSKVRESLIELIRKIVKFVKDKFFNKDSSKKLKQMQKIMENNPKLKNKKIEIVDPKALDKTGKKAMSDLHKTKAKLRSDAISPEEAEKEANKILNDLNRKLAAKKALKIVVPIAAALAISAGVAKHYSSESSAKKHLGVNDNGTSKSKSSKAGKKDGLFIKKQKAESTIEVNEMKVASEIAKEEKSITFAVAFNNTLNFDAKDGDDAITAKNAEEFFTAKANAYDDYDVVKNLNNLSFANRIRKYSPSSDARFIARFHEKERKKWTNLDSKMRNVRAYSTHLHTGRYLNKEEKIASLQERIEKLNRSSENSINDANNILLDDADKITKEKIDDWAYIKRDANRNHRQAKLLEDRLSKLLGSQGSFESVEDLDEYLENLHDDIVYSHSMEPDVMLKALEDEINT